MGLDINFYKTKREEVGYFRKVTFLLPFFNYKENLSYINIEKEKLQELEDACTKVLADHSLAEKLLPTQSGFFFGNTIYDEQYFNDVQEVLNWVKEILPTIAEDESLELQCWW